MKEVTNKRVCYKTSAKKLVTTVSYFDDNDDYLYEECLSHYNCDGYSKLGGEPHPCYLHPSNRELKSNVSK